ncbi:MAG: lipoprotein-releasing ABC transporter permease subunit [Deltaproteobacteria bacterium]|nr:lipoprotein-releasing ABC transporter permease subunit [Deltaproteobacteria bacterium]
MSFESFVSLRYLKSKRKQSFISMITVISIGGVALGVCATIIVLAVMSGFQTEWRDKILGVTAHGVVQSFEGRMTDYRQVVDKVSGVKGVAGATPYIYTQAIVAAGGRVSGSVVRGVDLETAERVSNLRQNLLSHDPLRLAGRRPDPRPDHAGETLPAIVLGVELARNLGVSLGGVARLVSPWGRQTPAGPAPKAQDFVITDFFESGMYEYDSSLSLLSLAAAQDFLNLGEAVTGVEIKVKDIYQAKAVSDKVAAVLGQPYWSRDWMEMNRNLFAALKLEKKAMFIILVLIILVAAFNIASTLIMVVMEKTKEIAIFKSFGATAGAVMRIFIYQGLIIGFLGTAIGLAAGLILGEILRRYQFIQLPGDIYYISTMPVRFDPLDVALITSAALVVSFLATIYPARQAAKLNPAEALRYE